MTNLTVPKQAVRRRGRWARRIPGIRLIARLLDGVPETFLSIIAFALFASVLGALYVGLAPYALHAPEVMGRIAADWCLERGSCDLTTNVVSMGLGVYLAAVVFLLLSLAINSSAGTTPQSIYFDVVDQLKQAGEAGIRPVQIAKRTGHELTDVHTILGYLYDDREVEICDPGLGDPVSYRVRSDNE